MEYEGLSAFKYFGVDTFASSGKKEAYKPWVIYASINIK